jgi:2-amino-4-hydroxy-6-hydroxymethyldihydropteridine diphosphokinase
LAKAYLSLGSNLGDRLSNLKIAVLKMEESDSITLLESSPVYETEPVGKEDQPWFLNSVALVETSIEPLSLLDDLLGIEKAMGRQREVKWGPRNVDLDILLYDDLIIDSDRLTLPHPQIHKRRFILLPLVRMNPDLMHPLLKKTVKELLRECPDSSRVKLFAKKI